MLGELCGQQNVSFGGCEEAHSVCEEHDDTPMTSLDRGILMKQCTWFLFASRPQDASGH
jgi:hypothetical protein